MFFKLTHTEARVATSLPLFFSTDGEFWLQGESFHQISACAIFDIANNLSFPPLQSSGCSKLLSEDEAKLRLEGGLEGEGALELG